MSSVTSSATSSPARTVRVLLVDDHSVVLLGLRTLLSADPSIDVVGEARDGREALALCDRLLPDIVIMDLVMEGMDGMTATRALVAKHPNIRVLALTMHDEEDYLIPILEAGASGYIGKGAVSSDLLDAVRTIAAGNTYVRPEAARVLASGWARRAAQDEARTRYDSLSERERDVFGLMAQGYTAVQIGERLFISAKTVDTYRRRINEKMGFTERSEYIRLALDLGLLQTG
jgi:DNA-binding NarL/FixJ family response regulator